MVEDRIAAVAQLYNAHREADFPDRLRAVDVAGVEMVMLDADVAGCVSTWLTSGGSTDDRLWDILATRERQLERVMPELSGQEAAYYRRLLDMAALILGSPE
jgi:hypothetical protein